MGTDGDRHTQEITLKCTHTHTLTHSLSFSLLLLLALSPSPSYSPLPLSLPFSLSLSGSLSHFLSLTHKHTRTHTHTHPQALEHAWIQTEADKHQTTPLHNKRLKHYVETRRVRTAFQVCKTISRLLKIIGLFCKRAL